MTQSHDESAKTPNIETSNTDDQLQREIDEALGGQSVEDLMQASMEQEEAADTQDSTEQEQSQKTLALDMRRGRISAIRGEDVFVELTGETSKMQGVVPLTQFDRPPRVGAIMDFVVERVEESQGLIHLSREGAVSRSTWEQLQRGATVEARVVSKNKGGLDLEMIGGVRAFMPASQVDLHHIDDFESFVGQKISAIVQEIDRKSKRVVLSRRLHLQQQREQGREKLMAELEVGQIREGTVSSVVEFGAFIDLGGTDGLVHVSDMSHTHVGKPSEVVKVGDKVKVQVLKIDPENGRIGLGMKQVEPDPWEGLGDSIQVGEQVAGRVVRAAKFGAFVEVQAGIEGLLPISEISWKRIHRVEDAIKEGDVLKLKVLSIDPAQKKMSLSLKQAQGDPWEEAPVKYAKDSKVTGKVISTTDFGAFVELEVGVEGLVHISELADRRVGSVEEIIKIGDEREFRVIELNQKERRIKLSMRSEASKPQSSTQAAQEEAKPKSQAAPRKTPKNLKSGLGDHGGLGMGLGDLKL